MKAFYYENENILRKAVELVFLESGHEIYIQGPEDQWLYRIKDFAPDLLIIDFQSLERSIEAGWEDILVSQIPVLLICENRAELSATLPADLQILKILEKPFSPFDLYKAVEEIFVSLKIC